MSWEEKYGGIWNLRLGKRDAVLSEQHWPDIDAVTVVVLRSDGLLSAFVLRKGNDPQWRMPFWHAPDGPALVETEDDANRYFRAVFGKEA
ncbi:hypothetical protein [Luteibacter jiangsuensis]